jgi:hypothetical protein
MPEDLIPEIDILVTDRGTDFRREIGIECLGTEIVPIFESHILAGMGRTERKTKSKF